MDLSTVKNVSPNMRLLKKIIALLFSIAVIVVSFMVINNANVAATDTINVIRIHASGGLPAYSVITKDHLETYSLIKKEYTSDMVLAADADTVLNKVTRYYLRDNSVLYKDQVVDEKPLKNEWLYELDEDYEVLTIPYNHLEAGGAVLLPGDAVRIRVSYEAEETTTVPMNDAINPNISVVERRGKSIKTEVLFDNIIVKDMLNAKSHSIYEIYKEVMKLGEDTRQEVMKSPEFMQSIVPRALLLAGTREQANNYAKYKSMDPQAFLITILSRANNDDIVLDELPTLEGEIESWTRETDG